MRDLTKPEELILDQLGIVWAGVVRLSPVHPADLPELALHIHAAQNIIMARAAVEEQQERRTSHF